MREQPGDEGARLREPPQAMAPQRVDRFTHGEGPHGRVVWRGWVDASAQAQGVHDLATGRGGIGPNRLL